MERFVEKAVVEVKDIINGKGLNTEQAVKYYLEEVGRNNWPESQLEEVLDMELPPKAIELRHYNWLKNEIIKAIYT